MKIAIDISPLQSGHSVRGIGFYLERLRNALITNFPKEQFLFFSDAREISSDVDIIHYPYFDPFQVTLPQKKKKKIVVTVHDLTPVVFPKHFPAGIKGKLRWEMQKHRLCSVYAVITDSDASRKDILRLTRVSPNKVHTVYLAAGEAFRKIEDNEMQIKKLRQKYHLPEKFILYVGDVTWNKNVPRLLEAIKQVNIPLVMVGKALVQEDFDRRNVWNADLVRVKELIKEDKNISLLGFVPTEDLVQIYNIASVFVWPSVYEGFGLPILEAMQCGCPVITSREGCMPEIAGDAAYFFDGYNTKSLAEAISEVFSSEKLQKELSAKGILQAKKFSWGKTAKETVEVYRKVMVQ